MQMAGLHSTAGPCCSPRKMAPINMLYLDQVFIINFMMMVMIMLIIIMSMIVTINMLYLDQVLSV